MYRALRTTGINEIPRPTGTCLRLSLSLESPFQVLYFERWNRFLNDRVKVHVFYGSIYTGAVRYHKFSVFSLTFRDAIRRGAANGKV